MNRKNRLMLTKYTATLRQAGYFVEHPESFRAALHFARQQGMADVIREAGLEELDLVISEKEEDGV